MNKQIHTYVRTYVRTYMHTYMHQYITSHRIASHHITLHTQIDQKRYYIIIYIIYGLVIFSAVAS